MLHYERFQEAVLSESGSNTKEWIHILPAVPMAFRNRFLYTMRKGFSVPMSFDMVTLSEKLTDRDYDLFIQQALTQKLSGKEINDGLTERVSINE